MLETRTTERTDEAVTLELSGRLSDDADVRSLKRCLEEQYAREGVNEVRVGVSNLRHVDLEGAAALASLKWEAARRGRHLRVVGATGSVRAKLVETGLLRYLQAS